MGSSLSADLVSGLQSGLSAEEAGKLWAQCDKKETGVLNRTEAKHLVQLLVDASMERAKEKLDKLREARSDPAQVDAFLSAFDISGDGKVEKDEFIKKAMEGYEIPLNLDEQAEEEGEEAEAGRGKEGIKGIELKDGDEFHDCNEAVEPPAKRARTGEKAEAGEEAGGSSGAKGDVQPGHKVKIVNVTTPTGKRFNGVIGTVVRWDAVRGRWLVRMPQFVVPTALENLEMIAK